MNKDIERARHNEFLSKYEDFYGRLIEILCDCVERDDVKELSLHLNYVAKILETALNLRLMIRRENERSGNA